MLALVLVLTLHQTPASRPVRQVKQTAAQRKEAARQRVAEVRRQARHDIELARASTELPVERVSAEWTSKLAAVQVRLDDAKKAGQALDAAHAKIELARLTALREAERKKARATAQNAASKAIADAELSIALAEADAEIESANADADAADELAEASATR